MTCGGCGEADTAETSSMSLCVPQCAATITFTNASSSCRVDLFELEFANVKMGLESRPRSKSYKFDIELGSLTLRDKVRHSCGLGHVSEFPV